MQVSSGSSRTIGRVAWYAAWVGTVLAPIHAIARFATEDGAEDLQSSVVSAWAEPASSALAPILGFSDAQTVYITYGKAWFFIVGAAALAAFVVRQRRPSVSGAEKWGWRIALPGYALVTLSLLGDYWTPWLEQSFLLLGIPGMLLSMVGCTTLGVGLLRRGYRPRATAWLLTLFLPLFVLLSSVVALGAAIMPMVWAWGISGRALTRTGTVDADAPDPRSVAA